MTNSSYPHSSGPGSHTASGAARIDWGSGGEREYDSLTDLFLGEVGPTAAVPPRADGREQREERAWMPVSPSHGQGRDPIEEYDPFAELMNEEAGGSSAGIPDEDDERGPRYGGRGGDGGAAGIELLVLGNLPVLGSVWATQYVRERVNRERRRIGLIRFTGSQASAEVISPDDERDQAFSRNGTSAEHLSTLAAALRSGGAEGVSEWVIRVDAADESAAACQPGIRTVTVLTSGDETARAGALRIIKELVPLLAEGAAVEEPPSLRVVVMGAGDEQARDAAQRLAQTMQRFVARPVEAVAMAGRIRSAKAPVLLYAGKAELDVGTAVRMLQVSRAAPASAPASRVSGYGSSPIVRAEREVFASSRRQVERPRHGVDVHSGVHPGNNGFDEPVMPRPRVAPRVSEPAYEQPPREPAPMRPAIGLGRLLVGYVPGLELIDAVCPYAPNVVLARDPHDGDRLHVLARLEHGRGNADSALGMLMTASAWADAHGIFLGRTAGRRGEQARRSGGEAVCHLFTDQPKAVRRLLETSLRVHLLAEVGVGEQRGWYHAELN